MPRGVFISYSTQDREFARKLAEDLRAHEIPVWFDEFELEPGDSIIGNIEGGIDRMEFLLVVLTPASVDSGWVLEEVRMAMHKGISGRKVSVIPILRKECRIPGFLQDKVHVDMRDGADYAAGLARLVRKIRPRLEFKSGLQDLKDKLDTASDAFATAQRGAPGDKILSAAGRIIELIDEVLRGRLAEGEWEEALSRVLPRGGNPGAAFDQRSQEVGYQINIGSLNFKIPLFPQSIDPENLKEAEARFRARVRKRFDKDSRFYVQLAGETTEPAPGVDDRSAPRSAVRCRRRIQAEYCEWIQQEQAIVRVKLDTLRQAVDKYPCVILLGAPGCGKTTALEHLAYELSDDGARLALALRLSEFEAGMSVEDFIANGWAGPEASGHWEAPELAGGLAGYLEAGRLFGLFDALNEMPQEGFAARARALRAFINKWTPKGNRFVVTCRVLDYGEQLSGLQRVEIQPLDDAKIKDFIQRELPEAWKGFWDELIDEKNSKRQLLEFARNPYMLTVMIDVFHEDRKLVRNRSELMQRFTEILVARAREVTPPEKWLDAEILRYSLSALAFEIQGRAGSGTMVKSVLARQLIPERVPLAVNFEPVPVTPDKVLGLAASAHLIEMTGDRSSMRFYHQLLQEYYAAREMIKKEPSKLADKWRWPWLETEMPQWTRPEENHDPLPPPPPTGWEETTIMAAGLKLENDYQLVLAVNAVNPVLAGRCLHEGRPGVGPAVRKVVVDRLLAAVSDPKVALRVRIAVGDMLGYLGDPRVGERVDVRAGEFKMGDDQDEDAKPLHELFLPDYQIGRYPVTNAEFSEFIQDGGYKEKRWWTKDGLVARRKNEWSQPEAWDDSRFNGPNQPVVGVSGYECIAYCNWKKALTKLAYRLPSEAEWEKAARGSDGRQFPWGSEFDPSRLNSYEGDQVVWSTTPVGVYPSGASPTGCLDMAGNVWEWTSSLWGKAWEKPDFKYPYRSDGGRENLKDSGLRVLRGGSWGDFRDYARCSYRFGFNPLSRFVFLGFRVVVSPIPSPSAP